MPIIPLSARKHLSNEAHALLSRLQQTEPFSVSMPMVMAAGISKDAIGCITRHWIVRRMLLAQQVHRFIRLLEAVPPRKLTEEQLQRHFTRIKLRFNSLLDQFDIFADVVNQRSEHRTGVWIAGLDILAKDALQRGNDLYRAPPLMCFVERGHGAAIRKARTRLPGGDTNPVAIIQVPRERLVGSGIAASVVHEVGHQGAALLDLLPSIGRAMNQTRIAPENRKAWDLLRRWLSEILADFWAMAHLGVGATLGLMSVVGLPTYFMFRYKGDDPHPFPWIRVMISLAFGEKMYPDAQWTRLRQLWLRLYPVQERDAETKAIIGQILACLPVFTSMVLQHQSAATKGRALTTLFPIAQRQPATLRQAYARLQENTTLAPTLVFAIIGQARADSRISNEAESRFLSDILILWARKRAEITFHN